MSKQILKQILKKKCSDYFNTLQYFTMISILRLIFKMSTFILFKISHNPQKLLLWIENLKVTWAEILLFSFKRC